MDTPNERATSPEVTTPEINQRLQTSAPKATVSKVGPSKLVNSDLIPKAGPLSAIHEELSPNSQDIQIEGKEEIITASKYLYDISPIPTIPVSLSNCYEFFTKHFEQKREKRKRQSQRKWCE